VSNHDRVIVFESRGFLEEDDELDSVFSNVPPAVPVLVTEFDNEFEDDAVLEYVDDPDTVEDPVRNDDFEFEEEEDNVREIVVVTEFVFVTVPVIDADLDRDRVVHPEVVIDIVGARVPFNSLVCVVVNVNEFVYDPEGVNVKEVLLDLIGVLEPLDDFVRIREAECVVHPEEDPVEEEDAVEVRVDRNVERTPNNRIVGRLDFDPVCEDVEEIDLESETVVRADLE